MIKSIDIEELSQNWTNKKPSFFPFAMCDEQHKEKRTHRQNFMKSY